MLNRVKLPRLALILAALALLAASTPIPQADPNRYIGDIKTLASPDMEGRGAGTKGLTRAEHLIEKRYKELHLDPAGVNGYAQPFNVVTGARLKSDNRLIEQSPDSGYELKINQDFVPYSFSSSGEATAPIVFVGYGVTADEFHYDDYAGIDVKDKIVVAFRYEPSGFAEKSGNHGLTQHSQLITKAINARNHGAKALIIVNGKLGDGEEDLLTRFGSVSGPEDVGIVMVQVKNAIADRWFQKKSLKDLQEEINSTNKPASLASPDILQISLKIDIETTRATVNNVLAWLPGQSDEYIIIGAHYDHLGRGNFDSLAPSQIGRIHPGADDNASGTAGVLELARLLAPQRGQLKRSILFMDFAGEELGLLGSAAWVKNPTKPLAKAVAMLNMDMIGRIKDDKVYIGGVGTGSSFKAVLEQAQKDAPFKIEYSAGGYSSSDHTSFVTKKIPVLFFFSGLHSDYHKPSDTWDKINSASAAKLLDMVESVALQLANADQPPAFQVVAEDKPAAGGGGGGYGPYFGSIPDFGQVETGVKFSDVKPNSPAAKAGLKAGDTLIQFGDKPIKNLYDFTDALRRSKVGDVVEVKVLRDGQPVTASVKLEQRK
ncbi:MAG TPA: M28 family peptidase [Candidatus Dormibacteraeota bacterium]|nr:M28 family peptidase [Candidatus Dormibacteraeota bacterium]